MSTPKRCKLARYAAGSPKLAFLPHLQPRLWGRYGLLLAACLASYEPYHSTVLVDASCPTGAGSGPSDGRRSPAQR